MADDPATPPEQGGVKPFAQFLQEQRRGVLHTELGEQVNDLVARCVETGKKGSLTLKVTFAPQKDGVTMLVTDEVKVTTPRHDSKPALFFPDADGNLLLQDPNQLQIGPLREVPGGKADPAALRQAGGAS